MCNYNETESGYCEYCNHESNEDAKRFPLFNENAKREEAFIDKDNYLSVYTESGEWVGVGIKFCPMCGRRLKGCGHFDEAKPVTFERTLQEPFPY